MDESKNQNDAPKLPQPPLDPFFETYGIRILRALRRIIRAVDIHSRELNQNYQITAPQMLCLYSLVRRGPMMLSALAKHVHLSVSTINGIVDRLEAKGRVQRHRDDKDRRKVYIEVTATGRAVAQTAPSLLQERFSRALRALQELEQATIALSLERVVELMEAEHLDTSPNLLPNAEIQECNQENQT